MPGRSPRSLSPAAFVFFGAAVAGAGCPRPAPPPALVAPTPLSRWDGAAVAAQPASFDAVALAPDGRLAVAVRGDGPVALRDAAGERPLLASTGAAVAVYASDGANAWVSAPLAFAPRALALAGDLVAVAGAGEASAGLRGAPGGRVVGLAAADGAPRWSVDLGSTEWALPRAALALPDGDVAIAGSFAGTLRAGAAVVTSAGSSDGFAVRLSPAGEVRWLLRLGGQRADAATALAALPGGDLAIGGTFTGAAELRGAPLEPAAERSLAPDGFVARLRADGGVGWVRAFGGDQEDSVAGIAALADGSVAVAATVRGIVEVDGRVLAARGMADAAVIVLDPRGRRRGLALLGGPDYDTASAIAATGDAVLVATTYAGAAEFGTTVVKAAGGDGAVLARVDAAGQVALVADLAGDGRETVAALAGVAGGYAVALRHTAGVEVEGTALPAPSDPYAGAVVLRRPW